MSDSIKVQGEKPIVKDLSIEIDFHDKRGTHSLHLWRPDPKSFGRTGMGFSHPHALRDYAMGLLDMADRFEALVRPEWEKRGGKWFDDVPALSHPVAEKEG